MSSLIPLPAAARPARLLSTTLDHLSDHSWAEQAFFLPEALQSVLSAECRRRADDGSFRAAAMGAGTVTTTRAAMRGDRILWIEAGLSDACDDYLLAMDAVREQLNRRFYLGLQDFETHFACYAPGAGYVRHLDRFRDDDARMVSAVLYLNDTWLVKDGGALCLYPPNEASLQVQPDAGRLVLFFSADIPHEVLASTRDRLSLAGWFRRAPGLAG